MAESMGMGMMSGKAGMDANRGSHATTHKTMKMKSNTKGVPECSTTGNHMMVDPGAHKVEAGHMPK